MKFRKNALMVIGTLVLLGLSSCSGNDTDENADGETTQTSQQSDTTPVTVNDETKFKFDFALANIPSPVGMMNEVCKWGESYNNELFNAPNNSPKYLNEFSKAINLGVYSMDMSYAIVNDAGSDVIKYMKAVMNLSDQLGMKSAIDHMIGKRAERNLDSKDSLLTILEDIFVRSDYYLRTNERVFTATSVFTGTWIEGFYLAAKIAEQSPNPEVKQKARIHLWEQRFHLGNLIAVLEDFKDKKEAAELITQFKKIHTEIVAVKDPKDMDDNKYNSIAAQLFALRVKFTS